MARMLVVGDLHFKSSNLVEGEELIRQILIKRKELGHLDAIVFLGDLLDNHATIHSQAFNLVNKLLSSLQNDKVFVLVGNHDYINNSQFLSTEHPFNVFKNWGSNLCIVDTVIEWQFGEEKFLFLPYIPTGRFSEALATKVSEFSEACKLSNVSQLSNISNFSKVKCIFCHQEFIGSVFEDKGDFWPHEILCVSGHIHEARWLKDQHVFYPGSPIQHCFAEKPEKQIVVYKSEDCSFEHHRLNVPQKYTFEWQLEELDKLVLPPNSHVRLRLKCTPSSWAVFKKSPKYKELTEARVKIQPLAIDDEVQLKKMARKRTTYIEALKTYSESSGGYVEEAFHELMKGLSA